MRDFYDIRVLLSIYEKDIDNEVLKRAFEATCKKRCTERLNEEAPKIISAIGDDAQLHTLWKSYQKKYPYAADISYEEVIESTRGLCRTGFFAEKVDDGVDRRRCGMYDPAQSTSANRDAGERTMCAFNSSR